MNEDIFILGYMESVFRININTFVIQTYKWLIYRIIGNNLYKVSDIEH
jgi:hypothetical protein